MANRAMQSFSLLNQGPGNYTTGVGQFGPAGGGLLGGEYLLVFKATGTGSAQLAVLAADGLTCVPYGTAITSTTAAQTTFLPPGDVQLQVSGFTAVYASLTTIPN